MPKELVEDVLVQVDKFIYPADFIVSDTQPVEACNSIPVILRRPFLATSNALINCRNGLMKLSFGNMTMEMNIFNICKQHGDNNYLQEVDFIEKLVYDQFQTTSSEIEFNESEDLQIVYFQEQLKASNWRLKLKNCHHDQLSLYLQVFNHQNLISSHYHSISNTHFWEKMKLSGNNLFKT